MKKILNSHHPRRHAKSFKYAFDGIFHTLLNEPNFRVQLVIVVTSIVLGVMFNITLVEWGLLTISMGLLLSAEMINTVVENVIDALINESNGAAKVIKDVSAGFVLISALTAVVILLLIFGKDFIKLFI
ncbi:diacylglycerol kinase family protein [Patescibacteria group bacterium]